MHAPAPEAAFARLRRDLVRRRWAAVEPWLRVELAAIAVLLFGFVFWQLRIRYASLASAAGLSEGSPAAVWRVAADVGGLMLGSGVLAGFTAGATHLRRLCRGGGAGPAWATVPAPPHLVARHLAWESRAGALVPALLAVPALVAAIGMVPPAWLALLAAAHVVAWLESTRLGCAVALRVAPRARQAAHDTPRVTAVLAREPDATARRRLRAPAWRRSGPARALFAKDAWLLPRHPAARIRVVVALLLVAGSAATWGFAREPGMAHVVAFGLAISAAAVFGEAVLALSGTDPFPILRTLPMSGGAAWRARAAWAAIALATVLGAQAAGTVQLSAGALRYFVTVLSFAAAAVLTLALNYAVTLYPRSDQAERLYGFSLGLAIVGSLLIPLLGWIVLLSAVVHSTRRLPRWWRLEERE